MEYIIGALAVYKAFQLIELLLPRPVMVWVKVVSSIALGYAAAFISGADPIALAGLAMSSLAGVVHGMLRLITLAGDLLIRRTVSTR